MKKVILFCICFVLLFAGLGLAAKGGNKPPPVDYQELIDAETQARIDADIVLQDQIDDIQLIPGPPGAPGPPGGIMVYDYNDQEIGVMLEYGIGTDWTILNERNFIFRVEANTGNIALAPIHFISSDCSDQGYLVDRVSTGLYESGNSVPNGVIFRTYLPAMNTLVYVPQGTVRENIVSNSWSCGVPPSGCCEIDNQIYDAWSVEPNDPNITGVQDYSYQTPIILSR